MDKHRFIAIIFVFVFVSTTCNASSVFHLRNLIASEVNNASATPPVSFFVCVCVLETVVDFSSSG